MQEGLVNHFIHRNYTVMGGEVHLDIYDDRISITSPRGMYSGQRVQDILLEEISSCRRNPVLADVMAQLDYMEKRGSGLKKIYNETLRLEAYTEERRPVFKSSVSQFMTTIYSVEYDGKQKSDPEAYQSDPEVINAVYEQIKANHAISRAALSKTLGISERQVRKAIDALRDKKIRRKGGDYGEWEIIESTIYSRRIIQNVVYQSRNQSPFVLWHSCNSSNSCSTDLNLEP